MRHVIAIAPQILEDCLGRGQRVEPHGMGKVPLAARIGGEDEGDASFPGR